MDTASPNSTVDTAFAFRTLTPKILYFGTPVALVSSLNHDGSPNLAPISSFWALGWSLVLGLLTETKTLVNLRARPECVVSLPTPGLWPSVERLAPLTGLDPVPSHKAHQFRFAANKFAACGLSPIASEVVVPPRVRECPVQMEACVRHIQSLTADGHLDQLGGGAAVHVEVVRVHVREDFVLERDARDYVDPAKWQPLIYNFRHYFGLGPELGKTFRAEV